MKARFLLVACFLFACSLPLFAQPTMTMSNGWNQTVTGAAATTTQNNQVQTHTLAPNQSWDTGDPANGNTMLQIKFSNSSGNLANTPVYITNVVTAKLVYNQTYGVLTVQLTPATGGGKHEHATAEANVFLAMKPPTRQFCLEVDVLKGHKTLLLANGMVVAATGKVALLPPEGKSGCVCGKGLPPAKGSDMEQFEVEKRCDTPKKK